MGDRVLGSGLDGPGQAQDLGLAERGERLDAVDGEAAGGHGAGLVQHDGVHRPGVLQDLRALDEDPELGPAACSGEESDRRGQPQRAGAGDDQHGHGRREGGAELGVADGRSGGEQPPGEGDGGDGQDDGDEHRTDPVREPRDGSLPGLRLGDQPSHLGEGGFGAHAGGADQEPAGGVYGGTRDRAVRPDFHRDRLAGH